MPIIVDEVVISVEVGNGEAGGSTSGSGAASADDKQALVEECVARVLEILREREEP
ncbi:MAG: hypothetical protein H6R13_2033 [Proteobacteria bacterium]|nr:hypothetical protein [Pseudomonadota bacterium]